MIMKALITDPIDSSGPELLASKGVEITTKIGLSAAEIEKIVSDFDILICRTSTKVTKPIIAAAKKLQCIGLVSTGWDHIDIQEANARGIAIIGLPPNKDIDVTKKGSFVPTSEHVILSMLAAAGNYCQVVDELKQGNWNKFAFQGTELFQKTLGIIGFGRIGQLVYERAAAFGMRILVSDTSKQKSNQFPNIEFVSQENLVQESDFISIHVHKNASTIDLINKETFATMKKGVILINTSRGGIINESDLLEALNLGLVRAAAIDVYDNSKGKLPMDLITHPRVLATPHIAGVSLEGQKRQSIDTAQNILQYLFDGDTSNIINSPNT